MSSADLSLQRAHAYIEDARDPSVDVPTRVETLDAARTAILDARRARAAPAHILPLFTSLCTHASSDRAHPVRAVLPAAVEDLVSRDMPNFANAATPFLARALQDEHVLVATRAVRALTTLFRKVVGFVVSSGIGDADGKFPHDSFAVWLQMQQKALSLIHAQDEGLRKAAVKFAETVVLAYTFSGSAGSADHFTLDYLVKKGSESSLLDPRALEEEGIRAVKSIAQLVHTSLEGAVVTVKPDTRENLRGLPPMSFMTAISVLGNLVRRRKKIIEFTLPPFLNTVAAVVNGSRGVLTAPAGILNLTESQRHSIIHVLRFNLLALRAYAHTRVGRVSADISQATADLESLEREEEARRKERASELAAIAARERAQKEAAAAAAEAEKRRAAAAQAHSGPSRKRLREPVDPAVSWPRLPPREAFALAQTIIQSMPPQEVVNFIMTRLLLNIPTAETVPGAQRAIQRSRGPSTRDVTEEPTVKRQRKSRFGSKEPERELGDAAPSQPAKKVAVVRKVAPPVVPVRLSSSTTEKLVTLCCRRILKKESQAIASGAGPLRIHILARLLTKLAQRDRGDAARKFCDEVCGFIVDNVERNIPLAQAWLFCLACEAELASIRPASSSAGDIQPPECISQGNSMDTENDKVKTELIGDAGQKAEPTTEVRVKVEPTPDASNAVIVAPNGNAQKDGDPVEQNGSADLMETNTDKAGLDGDGDARNSKLENVEQAEEVVEDDIEPLRVNESYNHIFKQILNMLKEKDSTNAESFSNMICEAPVLPPFVIETLKQFCHDPSRIKLGLHTLRDVILKRPGHDRSRCLLLLLEFTVDQDEVLRGPSIRLVANKIFVECVGEVQEEIERYAIDSLNSAIRGMSEVAATDEINRVERGSLLVTALCGQKHELLQEIASAYKDSHQAAQQVVLSRAKDIAAHLGMSAVPVVQLISAQLLPLQPGENGAESKTDGLEDLALEVLKAVLKKFGKPTEEIVEAANKRHELSGNTAFIVAVLPGLRKESLLGHLAAIVDMAYLSKKTAEKGGVPENVDQADDTSKTAGFKEIVTTLMSSRPSAISPAELLIELHHIDPSAAVSSAILACFELKSIYKQEVIAQAIQQLIEKTSIPDLFMRTVHLARIFYSELEKYLTGTVLKRLIDKQVWKNELLWEGFLIYCTEIKEKSMKLLVSLPAPQLSDALNRKEVLLTVFKGLFANPKNLKNIKSVKHRKVIQAAITKST